ncbi:MAG: transglutaminase family protein [Candidatus Odinarchaeota archaeon]
MAPKHRILLRITDLIFNLLLLLLVLVFFISYTFPDQAIIPINTGSEVSVMTLDRLYEVVVWNPNDQVTMMFPLGGTYDPTKREITITRETSTETEILLKDSRGTIEKQVENVQVVTDHTGSKWLNCTFGPWYYHPGNFTFFVHFRATVHDGGDARYPDPGVNRDTWLSVTDMIDHDTPEITAKANELTKNYKRDKDKVTAIFNFVNTEMSYMLHSPSNNASEVLEKMVGDCSEYSLLSVALCRAAGVPAREVTGYAYSSELGIVGDHSWFEWLDEENTWNVADAQTEMFTEIPANYYPLVHGRDQIAYSSLVTRSNSDVNTAERPWAVSEYREDNAIEVLVISFLLLVLIILHDIARKSQAGLHEEKMREQDKQYIKNDYDLEIIKVLSRRIKMPIYLHADRTIETLKSITDEQRSEINAEYMQIIKKRIKENGLFQRITDEHVKSMEDICFVEYLIEDLKKKKK